MVQDLSYQAAMKEPLLTAEEEAEAIRLWQTEKHKPSLEKLVRSHARLAYSMAFRYTKNPEHVKDLAAEGMTGLMVAADKFDSEKGTRFATYSRWWVQTKVTNALSKVESVIDIPARTYSDAKSGKLEGADRDRAFMAVYGSVALDAPLTDDEGMSAIDLMRCPRMNPEESAEANSDAEYRMKLLAEALGELVEREREVIIRRKLGPTPETLEQISNDLGVTRERIRQIESRAMSRLKNYLTKRGFSVSMLRE